MLRRLDALLKRDKTDLSDFRKDSLVLYQWKGAQLALPRDYGLQLIYYNTEQFQKEGLAPLPTDWNDKTWTFGKFLEVAQRLARGGERWALFVNRGPAPGPPGSTATGGPGEEGRGRPGHGVRPGRAAPPSTPCSSCRT